MGNNKPRLINIDKEREGVGGSPAPSHSLLRRYDAARLSPALNSLAFPSGLPTERQRKTSAMLPEKPAPRKKHASGVRTISRWGRSVSCTVMQSERLDCRAHGPEMESAVRGTSTSPKGGLSGTEGLGRVALG